MNPFTERDRLNLSGVPLSQPIAGMNALSGTSMWDLSADASYATRTTLAAVLCAASRQLERLARWHAKRVAVRKTRQELEALPNAILKDIGVQRGDIANLAEEVASRARPCH